jgi:exosortase
VLDESSRLSLRILVLVLCWLSFVLLIFGPSVFWRFRFPLFFLLLLVPLPDAILAKAVLGLQAASAKTSYGLFRLAGIPVTQSGFVLSLPGLEIEVAQECSGIRSTMMLLVTSLVLGHMFLKSGWQKLVLTLLVIPIAVLKNGVRIFVLAALAVYVDAGWLNGRLHHRGGVVFFLFGTALVGLIIWLLRHLQFGSSARAVPTPEAGIR